MTSISSLRHHAQRPALRSWPATCLVVLFGLTGCTGALRDQLAQRPYGAFAESQMARMPTPGDAEGDEERPGITESRAAAPGNGGASLEAELTAEELALIGVDADQAVLTAVQDTSWKVPSPLTALGARQAFLGRNPAVAAAFKRHRASHTRYRQVDYLNDLVRQYDAFAEGLDTGATTPHVMPQRPSWPLQGVGRLQSALAEIDVALSRARLGRSVLQTLVLFEQTFHDVLYWESAAKSFRNNQRLARQALDVAQSRYRAGRGSYAHVLLAQNRADLLRAKALSAEERADSERAQLASLLELDTGGLSGVDIRLDMALPSPPPRDTLAKLALASSPDVQEAIANATRSELMVELVKRQLLPELSSGASYTRTGDIPKRKGDIMFATRAPFLVELELVSAAMGQTSANTQRSIPAQADVQWSILSDATRSYELAAGSLRKRARQARDAAADAYSAGEVSYFDLDESLARLLEVELNVVKYRRDAFVAAARLHLLTGLPAASTTPASEGSP